MEPRYSARRVLAQALSVIFALSFRSDKMIRWVMARRNRIHHPTCGGISIIEVLVALLLLSLVIPGLMKLSEGSTSVQVASLRMENATAVAEGILDSLSLVPPSILPMGSSIARSEVVGGITYDALWWYTPTGTGHGTVEVDVRWSQGGKTHSIRLAGGVR